MSELYCIYKNKQYRAVIKNGVVEIISTVPGEEFKPHVDVVGRVHNDVFVKNINADEADYIYDEDELIKYKGIYFELLRAKIFKEDVLDNSYMICTESEQLAQDYDFKMKEPLDYIKDITREEIEAVKIIKKPLLKFKDMGQTEEILEGKTLDNWLAELTWIRYNS